MAIGTPVQAVAPIGSNATSQASGSFTPEANSVLFVCGACERSTSPAAKPTISDSLGLTWTEVAYYNYDPGANPREAIIVWAVEIGASPAAMTVTVASTGAGLTALMVITVTGVGLADTVARANSASGGSTVGDPSATLGAMASSSSAVLGFAYGGQNQAFTPPSGYTELIDTGGNIAGGGGRMSVAYDLAAPDTAVGFVSSNTNSCVIAIEVVEPAGGPGAQSLAPGLLIDDDTFFAPTVSVGPVALAPGLLANSNTLFAATVQPGAVALQLPVLTNTQSFPAASVSSSIALATPLLANSQSFPSPLVTTGQVAISPPLLTDGDTLFTPSLQQGTTPLSVPLLTDPDIFYAASVVLGAVSLAAPLLANAQSFPSASVSAGPVVVALPPISSGNLLFSATLEASIAIEVPLVANDNSLFAPQIAADGAPPFVIYPSRHALAVGQTRTAGIVSQSRHARVAPQTRSAS